MTQDPAMSTAVCGYLAGSPGYYVLREGEVISGPLMDFETARGVAADGDVVSYVIPKRELERACNCDDGYVCLFCKLRQQMAARVERIRHRGGIPKYKLPPDQPFVTTRHELWRKVITRSQPEWINTPDGDRAYMLRTGLLYDDFRKFTDSKAEPCGCDDQAVCAVCSPPVDRAAEYEPPSPHELWKQAGGDRAEYHRLMIHHGHLVLKEHRCSSCGISKQQILAKHEEIRLQLEAMITARDLCKQQTQEVSERYQALRAWLRENHPEVYAEVLARD